MKIDYLDYPSSNKLASLLVTRCLQKVLSTNIYNNAKLNFICVEEGISTLEVFDSESNLVCGVNSNINYTDFALPTLENSCVQSNESIVYLGCIWNCWGHFFTDGFSKVWYLLTDEYKKKYKGKVKFAISFIGNNIKNCPKPLLELYQLYGIEENDILVITEPTKFKSIIVPDNSLFFHNGTRHFTKEYFDAIQAITDAIEPINDRKFEKIYLSRTHFTNRNADFGEKSLENVFKRLGYTIIHPQEYNIKEQLSIFKTAKSFVSTTGSLGHNSVFCNPNTEVILLRKCYAIFDYQLVINEARNLDVTYVDTHLTCFVNEAPNNGPFFLYRNTNFCQFIKDRFGVIVTENFSTNHYMRYMRLCLMRNDMKYRFRAPEYYFEKLRDELKNDSWKRRWLDRVSCILPTFIVRKMVSSYFKFVR